MFHSLLCTLRSLELGPLFLNCFTRSAHIYKLLIIRMDCEQEHEAPETTFLVVRTRVCKTMFRCR
jgi:hypothetical protein